MMKTKEDSGSGIARLKIDDKAHFELKGQFLKELHDNTFSGSDNEDVNEHMEKVLKIFDLFYIPEEILKKKFLSKYCPPARTAKKMEEINNFQQEPDETLYQAWERIFARTTSTNTSDGIDAIEAQLNNLGKEIKKVNERLYAAQVGCESCNRPHYTKDYPRKAEGKTFEEAYYTQFGVPFPQRGRYRVAAPGFYQRDNGNPLYQERIQTMEESMGKFMAESAKRHDENSNLIKKIRATTDAAIRNQGASIKALEI
ncbi:hypothetical protein Tco_1393737 [Tanacetum coccineum]